MIGALGLLWLFGVSLQAQPLARYTFNDGTPRDISGNGLDGILLGNAEIVIDPERGQVLQVNQSGMQADGPFVITTSFTLSAWVKLNVPRTGRYYFGGPWWIRTDNQGGSEHHWCEIRYPGGSFVDKFDTRSLSNPEGQLDGHWHHIAIVLPEDGTVKAYVDGVLAPARDNNTKEHNFEGAVGPLFFGTQDENGGNAIDGYMDDIQVLNYAVNEDEIQALMEESSGGYPFAGNPEPADGVFLTDTWVSLSWRPGDLAVSHDVYVGDNFDVVNTDDTTGDTFRGNQTAVFYVAGLAGIAFPEGLVPGTTYYWRIDEVNEADPNSPWKGDIWSFTVPPKTAYYPDPVDGDEFVDLNVQLKWTPGFGAKVHTVYLGDDYDDVNDATVGIPAGAASYSPDPLELEKVYYWRIDEFDGIDTYKGDIWSFTTPGAVGNPKPSNGATNVKMTATLSWMPADNAASHELYFGTDTGAVKNATTTSPEYIGPRAIGAESYDPGGLAWDSSYAWRVDEVYPDGTIKGLVWTFTTADFIIVDDFEAYNDIDPPDPNSNTIFGSWTDGYQIQTNGALTAEELPPYVEQTVVHSGTQSMKYVYDTNLIISESTLTLDSPEDWTQNGVTKLSLLFRGNSINDAERMFIVLNGIGVVYHGDLAASQMIGWNQWIIDLTLFSDQGVDLTSISTMTIGFGIKDTLAAGGEGEVYFDDIRLYR